MHKLWMLLLCRLPEQCDGRPGYAAFSDPAADLHPVEGQGRGVQAGLQAALPETRLYGRRHEGPGVLKAGLPAAHWRAQALRLHLARHAAGQTFLKLINDNDQAPRSVVPCCGRPAAS